MMMNGYLLDSYVCPSTYSRSVIKFRSSENVYSLAHAIMAEAETHLHSLLNPAYHGTANFTQRPFSPCETRIPPPIQKDDGWAVSTAIHRWWPSRRSPAAANSEQS